MIKLHSTISNIVIIGCGGVTSWMIAPLMKLLMQCEPKPTLVLVDGDTIEERNLERQWFGEYDVGRNKAEAMAGSTTDDYPIEPAVTEYYTDGMTLPVDGPSLFLCCADNHAARRAVLSAVDRGDGWAIIAGNEYTEAEAYYYERSFKDTPMDPRVFYPAILTDNAGDPTRPEGCTGLAAIASPQLVLANFSAANHLLWLFYHHFVERPSDKEYSKDYMPVRTWNYGTNYRTIKLVELQGSVTAKET